MTSPATPLPENIESVTQIGEHNVITITRATVPIPGQNGTLNPDGAVSDKVFAVLLSDSSTVYIDAHYGVDCDKTFGTAHSVSAHYKVHSPRAQARATARELASVQAELDELKAKKAREFENRSNGARRAAEAKKAGAVKTPKTPSDAAQFNAVKKLINTIELDVAAAQGNLAKIAHDLRRLSTDVDKLVVTSPSEIDVDNLTVEQRFALVKKLMS